MSGSDALLREARERIEALPPYAVRSSFAKPVRKYAGALSKAAVLSVLDALRAALDATEPEPDFLDGARLEYRKCLEVRRLLGYLWTATGYRAENLAVRDLFAPDDPLVADVERLAIFPVSASVDREEKP